MADDTEPTPEELGLYEDCYKYLAIFQDEFRPFVEKSAQERGVDITMAVGAAAKALLNAGCEALAASLRYNRDDVSAACNKAALAAIDVMFDERFKNGSPGTDQP